MIGVDVDINLGRESDLEGRSDGERERACDGKTDHPRGRSRPTNGMHTFHDADRMNIGFWRWETKHLCCTGRKITEMCVKWRASFVVRFCGRAVGSPRPARARELRLLKSSLNGLVNQKRRLCAPPFPTTCDRYSFTLKRSRIVICSILFSALHNPLVETGRRSSCFVRCIAFCSEAPHS